MEAGASQTNVQGHEPMSADVARERASVALGNLENGQRDAMEELRVALCGYVGALRRQGTTREATLAAIHTFVATPVTPNGALALTPVVRDALAELTQQWCATEYDRLGGSESA
jgi:hypothetical protein